MAPHDRIIWLTHPDQINQIDEVIEPIFKDLSGQSHLKSKGLSVIIRVEDQFKDSVRYLYGILFALYQKITLFATRIDPFLTANLDLRVFLEHLCDIRQIMNYMDPAVVTFIVYEDGATKSQALKKPNVNFITIKRNLEKVFVPESPLLGTIPDVKLYHSVALGGTFDHLHSGHKLMLSLAALLTRDRILCGITASEMLISKNHPENLEPLEDRMFTVQEFLMEFKANCERTVEIVTLRDPFGPTIELEDLEALIVSPETLSGGLKSKNKAQHCVHMCG